MTMVASAVTPTERKIAEMLLENTGTHMLDSGGIYGRRWEQMRARFGIDRYHPGVIDYDSIAEQLKTGMNASIDRYGSLDINVFFYLTTHLEYDEVLGRKYDRWQEVTNWGKDKYDKEWGLPLMEKFIEQLRKHGTVSGIYGDGEPFTENTYNGECSLSHTLQYTFFTYETWVGSDRQFLPDGSYVLLQIHNGCDVRGGYTDPVLFAVDDEGFFSYNDASVECREHDVIPDGQIEGQVGMDGEILVAKTVSHRWYTDDGSHWYSDNYPDTVLDLAFDDWEGDRGKTIKATWDEDTQEWRCPIDGTKLEVYA